MIVVGRSAMPQFDQKVTGCGVEVGEQTASTETRQWRNATSNTNNILWIDVAVVGIELLHLTQSLTVDEQ